MNRRTVVPVALAVALPLGALSAPAASAQTGSLGSLSSAPAMTAPAPAQPAPEDSKTGEITQAQLAKATNDYRARHGLSPLKIDTQINSVAQAWAQKMAKDQRLSHNPSYAQQYPAGWRMAAENVLQNWKGTTAEDLVQQWHNSPGHRENMQNPRLNTLGVGIAYSPDGRVWAVQNLARY